MSVKKGYNRYFIIFQEEDKGYGIAIDKQPTGYAKIEVRNGKCRITVYAQNIKQEKGPYHFCVIDTDKSPAELVQLGEVRIDEIGTGETYWEYGEDNIGGSGQAIDKYNVAVLLAGAGPGNDVLKAPLCGFTGKERILWKDKIALAANPAVADTRSSNDPVWQEEQEPCPEPVQELDEEAQSFREYEQQIREEADRLGRIEKEPALEEMPELHTDMQRRVEGNRSREAGIYADNPRNGKHEGCLEDKIMKDHPYKHHDECYEDNYMKEHSHKHHDECHEENWMEDHPHKHHDDCGGKHADMFHHLLDEFEEITDDFTSHSMDRTRWWKIPARYAERMVDERHYPYLCTIFHLGMAYPNIDYVKYFYKLGHSYFGIKYDEDNEVKYLMYGIPGRNNIREQPYMGMTGFTKWVGESEGEIGVWIMFYNPRTGNFMVEKKK